MNQLVINAGSTSTKVAVFNGDVAVIMENIVHDADILVRLPDIWDQYDLRRDAIELLLGKHNIPLRTMDAVVSRGAPVKPMQQGVYAINRVMIEDAMSNAYGYHPCSIGCKIAYDLSCELRIPAYTVDPSCVDELIPYARYSGHPGMPRKSFYHALNQKAIGRRLAADLSKEYEQINAIIIHLGGGMSVAAHREGSVIDVNNGLDGDGPMAMERAGTLPAGKLVELCFSGEYTFSQVYKMVNGAGGVYAHIGTKDGREVERRIAAGDKQAEEVYFAMAYQIAKEIGGMACALRGKVNAIAFTGGLTRSTVLMDAIVKWISWIAPIHYYPGEDEMDSLMRGGQQALRMETLVHTYR